MGQLTFDEDLSRRLEVFSRTRDARRRRKLVHEALAAAPGERVLDVGCGPGFFAGELLDRVGPDGAVIGIDSSAAMLGVAAHRLGSRDNVVLREGDATALPVDDASVDAALSVQVLEYVPDVSAAVREMYRALRPGGRVVIWDVDWMTVSWYSEDRTRMQRVLNAWDEHLTHSSLPSTLTTQLRQAGFVDVGFDAHVFAANEYNTDSYGVALIPLMVDYVPGRRGVGRAEAVEWAAELRALGERGDYFFSCTQFCFHGRKAS
jgi:arsenite methyltransferase